MKKNEAIEMLGGSATQAAHAIGITPAAIAQWPEDLPPRIADRVRGAWARLNGVNFAPGRPTAQDAALMSSDKVELRGLAPTDLAQALDALAHADGSVGSAE